MNEVAPITAAWTSWTPVLTATTTNPTLGTGSSVAGKYLKVGKLVTAQFSITFGTSGVNAGNGIYRVSLPVTATIFTGSFDTVGIGNLFDSSAGALYTMTPVMISTTFFELYYTGTSVYYAQNSSPMTWAASDKITGTLTYQAA